MAISIRSGSTDNGIQVNGVDVIKINDSGIVAGGLINATAGDIQARTSTSKLVTPANLQSLLVSGTAVASTSGTFIDFTGIPSWAKRVSVILRDVSTNGASPVVLQIGSGSIQTTSYGGSSTSLAASSLTTTGFANGITFGSNTAQAGTTVRQGIFTVVNISSTNYVLTCTGAFSDAAAAAYGGATTALSGAMDRIRITTVNGTDVFDGGTINIMWE